MDDDAPQPDRRLLHMTFGRTPHRASIRRTLSRLAGRIAERDDEYDVLVDASQVQALDTALDGEFMAWIVTHHRRLRRFAIVPGGCDACDERVRRLALLCRKPFRLFEGQTSARRWLEQP